LDGSPEQRKEHQGIFLRVPGVIIHLCFGNHTYRYSSKHSRRLNLGNVAKFHFFFFFTAVKIQVEVFWVVTQCGVVVRYQRFRDTCCLPLEDGFLPPIVIASMLNNDVTSTEVCDRPDQPEPYQNLGLHPNLDGLRRLRGGVRFN